jgi:hypothetical protein
LRRLHTQAGPCGGHILAEEDPGDCKCGKERGEDAKRYQGPPPELFPSRRRCSDCGSASVNCFFGRVSVWRRRHVVLHSCMFCFMTGLQVGSTWPAAYRPESCATVVSHAAQMMTALMMMAPLHQGVKVAMMSASDAVAARMPIGAHQGDCAR